MRDALEAVVDVQTRDHHEEAIRVDAADERRDDEAVPALVRVVQQAVGGVGGEQWHRDPVKVFERLLVVFLCFLLER